MAPPTVRSIKTTFPVKYAVITSEWRRYNVYNQRVNSLVHLSGWGMYIVTILNIPFLPRDRFSINSLSSYVLSYPSVWNIMQTRTWWRRTLDVTRTPTFFYSSACKLIHLICLSLSYISYQIQTTNKIIQFFFYWNNTYLYVIHHNRSHSWRD